MSVTIPITIAATILLRNPFWPVGYEGDREAISDEPRLEAKVKAEAQAQAAADDDKKTSVTDEAIAEAEAEAELANNKAKKVDRLWINARKSLKIDGARMIAKDGKTSHQALIINGRVYADGDLISINVGERRYTWRVRALTESGTLKLQRIKFRDLEKKNADDKGE